MAARDGQRLRVLEPGPYTVALMPPLTPTILLEVVGTHVAWPVGVTLYGALMQGGVLVPGACSGHGACGLCVVWLSGARLPPPGPQERCFVPAAWLAQGARLACRQRRRRALAVRLAPP